MATRCVPHCPNKPQIDGLAAQQEFNLTLPLASRVQLGKREASRSPRQPIQALPPHRPVQHRLACRRDCLTLEALSRQLSQHKTQPFSRRWQARLHRDQRFRGCPILTRRPKLLPLLRYQRADRTKPKHRRCRRSMPLRSTRTRSRPAHRWRMEAQSHTNSTRLRRSP